MSTLPSDIEEFVTLHTQFKAQQLSPEGIARYKELRAKVQQGLNEPAPVGEPAHPTPVPSKKPEALRR